MGHFSDLRVVQIRHMCEPLNMVKCQKKRVKFVFMRLEKKRISDILRVYETVNIFMGGML